MTPYKIGGEGGGGHKNQQIVANRRHVNKTGPIEVYHSGNQCLGY